MVRIPETKEEAVGFLGKALWWGSRLHLAGIMLSIVSTIVVQLLVGFWDFRSEHQTIIRANYEETLEVYTAFQRQLERFNSVFEDAPVQGADTAENLIQTASATVREITQAVTYGAAAQVYTREIKQVSRLLPGTEDELGNCVDAISELNRYYAVTQPPEMGSVQWVNFYAQFRENLEKYIIARDAYLEELASEVGGYWRAVGNLQFFYQFNLNT